MDHTDSKEDKNVCTIIVDALLENGVTDVALINKALSGYDKTLNMEYYNYWMKKHSEKKKKEQELTVEEKYKNDITMLLNKIDICIDKKDRDGFNKYSKLYSYMKSEL